MRRISRAGVLTYDAEQAWTEGTNLRTCLRYQPEETRLAVVKAVKGVVDFIDAKKTLESPQDIILTAEHIIQSFPTLKLEELAYVCQGMCTGSYGKFYERLKTAEFSDCIQKHEATRAELLERLNRPPVTRGLRPGQKIIPKEPETLSEVIARRHPLRKVGRSRNGDYLRPDADRGTSPEGADQQPE